MNQTLETDDELIALLERTMGEVARAAPEMSLEEPDGGRRWLAGAAAAATVVAGVAGVALLAGDRPDWTPAAPGTPSGPPASSSLTPPEDPDATEGTAVTWASVPATDPPGTSPDESIDTLAPGGPDDRGEPPPRPLPIDPGSFPDEVPRPDTFNSMSIMTFDEDPVGWHFSGWGAGLVGENDVTDDVSACTQYAAEFSEAWIRTPITNEASSVIYARFFDNGDWRVGVYCNDGGDYSVQVMRSPVEPEGPPA